VARAEESPEERLLGAIFPRAEENAQLVARLRPLWSEHLRDGWNFFNSETGLPETSNPFQIDDPRIAEAIRRRQIQGAEINGTTEADLRAIIRTSFEDGLSSAEMGDRMAEYYANNCVGETSARPMTAARTQTAGIVNDGRLAAAMEVGGLLKGWGHGNPNEPREAHIAAAEKYDAHPIPLDEPFIVNGVEIMSPGAADAPIGEIANCTCFLTFHKAGAA
jgi:hypothetical protein